MSQWSDSEMPAREGLSALMDGELDADALARACDRWREDPASRADWHAYLLIGDVLRSEDLASTARRDRAFLDAIRTRLADEPVILAPAAPVAPEIVPTRRARRAWAAPAAIAAGFVAVAGVLVVTQMSGSEGDLQPAATLAQQGNPGNLRQVSDVEPGSVETPPVVLNGQLIRDVRLDEYLAAHKKFGGSSAPGGPSGFLRNAAVESTGR